MANHLENNRIVFEKETEKERKNHEAKLEAMRRFEKRSDAQMELVGGKTDRKYSDSFT